MSKKRKNQDHRAGVRARQRVAKAKGATQSPPPSPPPSPPFAASSSGSSLPLLLKVGTLTHITYFLLAYLHLRHAPARPLATHPSHRASLPRPTAPNAPPHHEGAAIFEAISGALARPKTLALTLTLSNISPTNHPRKVISRPPAYHRLRRIVALAALKHVATVAALALRSADLGRRLRCGLGIDPRRNLQCAAQSNPNPNPHSCPAKLALLHLVRGVTSSPPPSQARRRPRCPRNPERRSRAWSHAPSLLSSAAMTMPTHPQRIRRRRRRGPQQQPCPAATTASSRKALHHPHHHLRQLHA